VPDTAFDVTTRHEGGAFTDHKRAAEKPTVVVAVPREIDRLIFETLVLVDLDDGVRLGVHILPLAENLR
jgi:hypothetical protein